MEQTLLLFEKLKHCSEDRPEWNVIYDDFVGRLTMLEMGKSAPAPGTPFPPISLPDAQGEYRNISDFYRDGPVVISFNRGGWCPYCREELKQWSEAMPALKAAGGQLIVIAGEVSGRGDALQAMLNHQAEVLCDVDHGAALSLGIAFHAGAQLIKLYRDCGLDMADIYGTESGILPIPATFVVDSMGIVRYAFVDPDFRERAKPEAVIEVLASLSE